MIMSDLVILLIYPPLPFILIVILSFKNGVGVRMSRIACRNRGVKEN